MRKIFSFVMVAFLALSAFAESYEDLLKKAKDYEVAKQYVYAMGSYYDAMRAKPDAGAAEAYAGFARVSDFVGAGKLANGKAAAEYRAWERVCREFEKYFTENVPVAFSVSEPDCTDMGSSTYTVKVGIFTTYKFNRIYKCVKAGYDRSWSDSWGSTLDKEWPRVSSYKAETGEWDRTKPSGFLKDGTAVYKTDSYDSYTYTSTLYNIIKGDDYYSGRSYLYNLKLNIVDASEINIAIPAIQLKKKS